MAENGDRNISIMPRNSVGLLNMSTNGDFQSTISFFWHFDTQNTQHGGFFSPTNQTTWFWPTAGIVVEDNLFVLAYEVYMLGNGQWGFAFIGTSIIHVTSSLEDDPFTWQYYATHIPTTENQLNYATAITKSGHYVYLVGNYNNQNTILSRIRDNALLKDELDLMEYYLNDGSWGPFSSADQLFTLFSPAQSEATINFNTYMNLYYMIILDPFSTKVNIRTAPQITGPWTDEQLIYEIPAPWSDPEVFCYATKAHPEFQQENNEILFTFMSNTKWELLTNMTSVYIPQMIRVTIQ